MKRISLLLLSIFIVFLSACSSKEPQVTRYMTVREYNEMVELVDYMLEDSGYAPTNRRASTYYKYVLYDDHALCLEGGFITCSDSKDNIRPDDRCMMCGKTWSAHEHH